MPPDPLPSRFSDWSSLGSPCTRTSPLSSPDVRTEQQENIPDLTNVPSAVGTRQERNRTSSQEEAPVAPQIDQQREEQNVSAIEVAPELLRIEVEMQGYDVDTNRENEDNVLPVSVSASVRSPLNVDELIADPNVQQEARYGSAASRGSQVRTQDANMRVVPNAISLERLTLRRGRTVVSENMDTVQCHQHERIQSHYTRRDIPDDSSDEHGSFREHGYYNKRGRPLGETRYPNRGRRPPRREESYGTGRPPDGGRPPNGRRPPDGGRPPGGGGLPDGGGPPDDGGPPGGNGGPP